MDTVTASNSVFVNGQWATAHWHAEVVDEATGDLVITAVLASDAGGPVVSALRMTSDLVRELRVMAGLEEAATYGAMDEGADARMAEIDAAVDRVGVWREMGLLDAGLHKAFERIGEYDTMLRRELRRVENRIDQQQAQLDGWEGALNERVTQLEERLSKRLPRMLQQGDAEVFDGSTSDA